jgi:hypothetical protein
MPIDRLGSPDIHGCAGCVAESGASGIAGAEAVAPGVSAGEGVSAIGIGGGWGTWLQASRGIVNGYSG